MLNLRAAAVNIAICTVIGGLIAYFSSAKWLAATLWVFAAVFANGTIAAIEDARPGGFDNPNGLEPRPLGYRFLLGSLLVVCAAVAGGAYVQFQ